jgi:TrmH family RNA methyltransferase
VFVAAERVEDVMRQLSAAEEGVGARGRTTSIFPVTDRVARRITTLETPPEVMGVFPLPHADEAAGAVGAAVAGEARDEALGVYADGIADPGNLGTLIRGAVAFGAAALVTSPGSADVYGPKTVRASVGAVFGLPLLPEVQLGALLARLSVERVYGLAAHEGMSLAVAELRRPAVLVVGAERAGLSADAVRHVTDLVTIPLTPSVLGIVESLNAGVAGAIALYEFSRRPAGVPTHLPSHSAASAKG